MRIKTILYAFLSLTIFVQSLLISAAPVYAEESIPTVEEESYLIISAVQITGGTGKTQEDFIELFNPTDIPFDLNGHRLVKRTAAGTIDTVVKAWSEGTIVQPHHFYLWANSGFSLIAVSPDSTSSATLADNNGIALRDGENDSGEILDSLAWGSTANGFENKSAQNPSANESLVRSTLFEDTSGFNIKASDPRNSSVVFDQETDPEEEEPVEEPIEEEEEQEGEPEEVIDIKITELLPNPSGSDAGFEQVEFYNAGISIVNLEGYKIDDVASNQPLSTNAYTLPSLDVEAGAYESIIIPAGSMSLNNTGGDVLSLFSPTEELVDTIFYEESSPEAKSYSYFETGWEWADSTFGENNGQLPQEDNEEDEDEEVIEGEIDYDNSGLEITEVFPQPNQSGTEFVEIYNSGTETAQISHISLYVGERKKFLSEYELEPGKYFVVEQNSLPIQLRNSGQIVKLQEGSTVLSTVEYPLAVLNASFAKFEDGFLWTMKPTKSADNVLEIPEIVKKEISEVATKTAIKKSTSASTKAAAKSPAKASTATLKNTQQTKTEDKSSDPETPENISSETQKKQKESLGKIIAMGAAAVVGGVVALYKLVFTSGVE